MGTCISNEGAGFLEIIKISPFVTKWLGANMKKLFNEIISKHKV